MHTTGPHHLSLVTVHWGHLPPNQSDLHSHLWAFKEPVSIFFMVSVLTSGFLLPMSLPLWHPHSHTVSSDSPLPLVQPASCRLTILSHSDAAVILHINQYAFCLTQRSLELCCMFCFVLLCRIHVHMCTHTHISLKLCLWLSQCLFCNTCYVSAWFP